MKKTKPSAALSSGYFTLNDPLRYEGPKFKPSSKRPLGYRWYDPDRNSHAFRYRSRG